MYPPPRSGSLGRAGLVIIKLIALFLVLATVLLVISSLMFFLPDPPQLDTAGSSFGLRFNSTNLTALLDGNLSLTIHGLYNLDDVHATVRAVNQTGFLLANATQGPFALRPNVPHRERIVVGLALGPWMRNGWPITHWDNITVTLGVRARYTTGLVRANVQLSDVLLWAPPLKSYRFDTANSTFTNSGSNVIWRLPYTLDTSPYLAGSATVQVTIANETSTITSNTTTVRLGGLVNSAMNFTLTQAQALELRTTNHTLKVTLRVTMANGLSFTVTQYVAWRRRVP